MPLPPPNEALKARIKIPPDSLVVRRVQGPADDDAPLLPIISKYSYLSSLVFLFSILDPGFSLFAFSTLCCQPCAAQSDTFESPDAWFFLVIAIPLQRIFPAAEASFLFDDCAGTDVGIFFL